MIEKDLYVEQYLIPPRIDVPQGTNVQQLKFNFMDIVPEGTPRIYIEKPSGAEIYNDAFDYDFDSVPAYVVFDTTTQMTAESGQMNGQVRVVDSSSKVLNSFPILFNVVESPASVSAIESKDEFTALDAALNSIQPAIDAINATNTNAQEAESERVTAEQGRVTAEQGRVTAEQGRVSAEQDRVTAESTRVQNEETRQQWYNTTKQEIDGATFTIGSVTTGAAGSQASAEIVGDPFQQQLNLVIPKGDKGDPGDAGTVATSTVAGVVKPGDTLKVSSDGTLNVRVDNRPSSSRASDFINAIRYNDFDDKLQLYIDTNCFNQSSDELKLRLNTLSSYGSGLSTSNGLRVLNANLKDSQIGGVRVAFDSHPEYGLDFDSNGILKVNSNLSSFAGTGRTYYTTGDPMTVTADMNNQQIVAPCTIINPTTGVIVVDDGK